jgi:hypothetical protein
MTLIVSMIVLCASFLARGAATLFANTTPHEGTWAPWLTRKPMLYQGVMYTATPGAPPRGPPGGPPGGPLRGNDLFFFLSWDDPRDFDL